MLHRTAMCNILLENLPNTVNVGGREYRINSDFRTSVKFELLMMDDELTGKEKLIRGLRLYYPKVPYNIPKAVDAMLWFYGCGKNPEKEEEKEEQKKEEQEQVENETAISAEPDGPVYSFEHDSNYIYAAFYEQYGIDLQKTDMHWWKFRALFASLGENVHFVKIMGYRSIKINSAMSKEQRSFYKKMKDLYALPLPKEEQEFQQTLEEALMNGGDLTGIV